MSFSVGTHLAVPCMVEIRDRAASNTVLVGSCCVNGKRSSMEDAHVLSVPPTNSENDGGSHLFSVLDGHGGKGCSQFAAKALEDRFVAGGRTFPESDEEVSELMMALDDEWLSGRGATDKSGATCTACFVAPSTKEEQLSLKVANAGDSRTLIVNNGKCLFESRDHNPKDEGERDRIEAAGFDVDFGRIDGLLAVSRGFGDAPYKTAKGGDIAAKRRSAVTCAPETYDVTLPVGEEDRSLLVLVCDGVFENRAFGCSEALAAFMDDAAVEAQGDPALIASLVCRAAVEQGSGDNVSCVVVAPRRSGVALPSSYPHDGQHSRECVPGNVESIADLRFRTAFIDMCIAGGSTPGRMLEVRYDEVKAAMAEKAEFLAGVPLSAQECEVINELSTLVEGAADRTAYFQLWIDDPAAAKSLRSAGGDAAEVEQRKKVQKEADKKQQANVLDDKVARKKWTVAVKRNKPLRDAAEGRAAQMATPSAYWGCVPLKTTVAVNGGKQKNAFLSVGEDKRIGLIDRRVAQPHEVFDLTSEKALSTRAATVDDVCAFHIVPLVDTMLNTPAHTSLMMIVSKFKPSSAEQATEIVWSRKGFVQRAATLLLEGGATDCTACLVRATGSEFVQLLGEESEPQPLHDLSFDAIDALTTVPLASPDAFEAMQAEQGNVSDGSDRCYIAMFRHHDTRLLIVHVSSHAPSPVLSEIVGGSDPTAPEIPTLYLALSNVVHTLAPSPTAANSVTLMGITTTDAIDATSTLTSIGVELVAPN